MIRGVLYFRDATASYLAKTIRARTTAAVPVFWGTIVSETSTCEENTANSTSPAFHAAAKSNRDQKEIRKQTCQDACPSRVKNILQIDSAPHLTDDATRESF